MTRMVWGDKPPMYDAGLDRGVLYFGTTAVPWNGLVSVSEQDTGEVSADYYFEGSRLAARQVTGDYRGLVSAYTYPDIFVEYDGFSEHDDFRRFALSYRTQHGPASRLHIVYNVVVNDGDRAWSTIDNKVDPSLFNWDIYASAVPIPGASPASHLSLEVTDSDVFSDLEDILYGTDTTAPRLPDPAELVELYESATILRITYNGDGTYTATGPDDMVQLFSDGRFSITSPSLFLDGQDIFVVNSY